MPIDTPLNVLIADDHALVRKGLRDLLREQWPDMRLTEARDGTTALERLRAETWDLVILDITMPGLNGLEVLRLARQGQPNLRALLLSMHSSAVYVARSLKAGAVGYLSKETAPEELVTAVKAVLAGGIYLSHDLLAQGGLPLTGLT